MKETHLPSPCARAPVELDGPSAASPLPLDDDTRAWRPRQQLHRTVRGTPIRPPDLDPANRRDLRFSGTVSCP